MRIAFFVGGFPLISETFISRQISGLIDLGHEVDIFAEKRPPEEMPIHPEVLKYDLIAKTHYIDTPPASNYWEMPVLPISGQTWLPGSEKPEQNLNRIMHALPTILKCALRSPKVTADVLSSSKYGYQALSLSALYRLSKLCEQSKKYDVLHAHFGPNGNTFRFAKQLWKAPFVVTFHGYDFSIVPQKEGRNVYQNLFEIVDAVTVNSKYTRSQVESLGCPAHKIHKLAVGLNLDEFPFHGRELKPGEKVRVVTVGRLTEKKGLEYSIRAIANVREKHPEIVYDIIGEGALRPKLQDLIQQLAVGDVIRLHGARDTNYVRQIMEQSHIFVLSSVTAENGDQEGQGLVLQEAQASGLPILATDHNGFSESIAPNESGFLVPERDVAALSERLTYLLEHPHIWSKMGRAGRKYIGETYDIRMLNRQLVCLYEQIINENRKYRLSQT